MDSKKFKKLAKKMQKQLNLNAQPVDVAPPASFQLTRVAHAVQWVIANGFPKTDIS